MRLKRGEIRAAHFSRQPGTDFDAASCLESALHLRAKTLIASGDHALSVTWHCWKFRLEVASAQVEAWIPAIRRRVDVSLWTAANERLIVEVCYANPKDEAFAEESRGLGLPVLELTVKPEDAELSESDFVAAILGRQRWIAKPRQPFASEPPPSSPVDNDYFRRIIIRSCEARRARELGFRLATTEGQEWWEMAEDGFTLLVPRGDNKMNAQIRERRFIIEMLHVNTGIPLLTRLGAAEAKLRWARKNLQRKPRRQREWEGFDPNFCENKNGSWVRQLKVDGRDYMAASYLDGSGQKSTWLARLSVPSEELVFKLRRDKPGPLAAAKELERWVPEPSH